MDSHRHLDKSRQTMTGSKARGSVTGRVKTEGVPVAVGIGLAAGLGRAFGQDRFDHLLLFI